jgi:elongation factor 4
MAHRRAAQAFLARAAALVSPAAAAAAVPPAPPPAFRLWRLAGLAAAAAPPPPQQQQLGAPGLAPADFSPARIRNFSIIAHVDHGKSTLADRLLERCGAIAAGARSQYLDRLQVERERGITVKAQCASLVYRPPPGLASPPGLDPGAARYGVGSQPQPSQPPPLLLNLIDTPGHVDFGGEVARSLAACQGVLLLVDASQGVQAQTVANFRLARERGLAVVPVLNKIDMDAADPARVAAQLRDALGIDPAECLLVSAKTGAGLDAVLAAVAARVPPPAGDPAAPLRALLLDAHHDAHRGVVGLIAVVDGVLARGDRLGSAATGARFDVGDVGALAPEPRPTGELRAGQVGFALLGVKDVAAARQGDTLFHAKQVPPPPPLPGFRAAKPMVFAGVFPLDGAAGFERLAAAVGRLTLNDASVAVRREASAALGAGFRCGFLGLLHMDVFRQRLEQEHGAEVLVTAPTVPVRLEPPAGPPREIQSAAEFPLDVPRGTATLEPTVRAAVVTPAEHVGALMELCQAARGELLEHAPLPPNRVLLRYQLPLAELAGGFYDELKSRSSGYATFDYEEGDYRRADLVRLDLLVNGEPVDALARVVPRERAAPAGRALVAKLKELLSRQQFDVALQAAAGGKVVARETIKALRKNVLAKCYGGDVSRKKKLLKKQAEGKKRMRRLGSVDVPTEALHEIMRS